MIDLPWSKETKDKLDIAKARLVPLHSEEAALISESRSLKRFLVEASQV